MEIEQMTDEQLAEALSKRQAAKKAAETEKRKQYEADRLALAERLTIKAFEIERAIEAFHEEAKSNLINFRELAREYGGLRANSKGGYSIETERYKATLRHHAIWTFDERATMAEELIKDFMSDTVKKRDKALYEILMSLLERNRDGKLEPRRVMDIIAHEDKFQDERWIKAIKLLKESYQSNSSKYYMEFSYKENDKWKGINLNFSAL